MPNATSRADPRALARHARRAGRAVALLGVVLPLFLIGILKFTATEIAALTPLIAPTPWLAWLYAVLGAAGTSYLLGVVEIATAVLFVAAVRVPAAGVAAGALGTATFVTTLSIMLAVPVFEAAEGGFPFLNPVGAFLIKDVALLGISLVVLGESAAAAQARG